MPSYQNASSTEPAAPTQKISMLLGTRETAVSPPFGDALPAAGLALGVTITVQRSMGNEVTPATGGRSNRHLR